MEWKWLLLNYHLQQRDKDQSKSCQCSDVSMNNELKRDHVMKKGENPLISSADSLMSTQLSKA